MTGYILERLGLFRDALTEREAAELYGRVSKLAQSELTGDLQTGFRYWVTSLNDSGTVLKLVRCTVTPMTSVTTVVRFRADVDW